MALSMANASACRRQSRAMASKSAITALSGAVLLALLGGAYADTEGCHESKCRSPDGKGGYDCWAGNGEAFSCADGLTATKTSKTVEHQGQTYEHYTCCDSSKSVIEEPLVIVCGAISVFAVISAGALRVACGATVPLGWLVLIVVYGLTGFIVILLAKVIQFPSLGSIFGGGQDEGDGEDGLIGLLIEVAGSGIFVHVPIMVWFSVLRSRETDEQRTSRRESRAMPRQEGAEEQEKEFVVVSAKMTIWQTIFLLTVGTLFALISFVIWVISILGPDFSPIFFPLPFLDFYKAKLLASSFRIKKSRVYLNASYADSYFLFAKEKMWNLYTFGFYKRIFGDTYPKWLDAHLQWVGAPPEGFNSYFTVFFKKGTLFQRIYYYVMKTLFFSLLGWIPFTSPLFLSWHYRQMLSRLVLGGRVPEVDKEYTVGAFYKVYFMSCCGLCASKITTFVDSHIVFDMSKPIKGPDAEELHELEQLRHDDETDAAAAGASAAPGVAAASIAFDEAGKTGGRSGNLLQKGVLFEQDRADTDTQVAITVENQAPAASITRDETGVTGGRVEHSLQKGILFEQDRADTDTQVAIKVENQVPAVGPLTAPVPSVSTPEAASIPTMQPAVSRVCGKCGNPVTAAFCEFCGNAVTDVGASGGVGDGKEGGSTDAMDATGVERIADPPSRPSLVSGRGIEAGLGPVSPPVPPSRPSLLCIVRV